MAFTPINTNVTYIAPGKMKKGQQVTGTFVESYEGQYGLNHKFSVDGSTVIINGCGHLNFLMKNIIPTTLTQVTYLGKEKLSDGKFKNKDVHQFSVAIDKETVPDTPTSANSSVNKTDDDKYNEMVDEMLNTDK